MRVVVLLACCLLPLASCLSSGCSQFQAKGPMAATIDANAQTAAVQQDQAAGNAISVPDAQGILATNAATMVAYRDAATTNPFAWLFGPKAILCNAHYMSDLERDAALFPDIARRATTMPADDGTKVQLNRWVLKENQILWMVKDAKDAKASDAVGTPKSP